MRQAFDGSRIIALHGFLGLPSDWDSVFSADFERRFGPTQAWNLWSDLARLAEDFSAPLPSSGRSPSLVSAARGFGFRADGWLEAWAGQFTDAILSAGSVAGTEGRTSRPVLIGYSMGGRLAMHAVCRRPDLFAGAIFISSHPGLANAEARQERRERDSHWAKRFLDEDWRQLMNAWEAQTVFAAPGAGAGKSLRRDELDFDRVALAQALTGWSLGWQRDLRSDLSRNATRLFFIAGEDDTKFARLISDPSFVPTQRKTTVPKSGHRLPWQNPSVFCALVSDFLESLSRA